MVLLGFGLTIGSFYYGDQFGEIRTQQMRIIGPMVTLHGWVVIGWCAMRAIVKNYNIQDVRIIGEVPFLQVRR